jgi:hypothetical protein
MCSPRLTSLLEHGETLPSDRTRQNRLLPETRMAWAADSVSPSRTSHRPPAASVPHAPISHPAAVAPPSDAVPNLLRVRLADITQERDVLRADLRSGYKDPDAQVGSWPRRPLHTRTPSARVKPSLTFLGGAIPPIQSVYRCVPKNGSGFWTLKYRRSNKRSTGDSPPSHATLQPPAEYNCRKRTVQSGGCLSLAVNKGGKEKDDKRTNRAILQCPVCKLGPSWLPSNNRLDVLLHQLCNLQNHVRVEQHRADVVDHDFVSATKYTRAGA